MNEFLKTLLNIRSLRASLRELSFEQLEEAKAKFDSDLQVLECNLKFENQWLVP